MPGEADSADVRGPGAAPRYDAREALRRGAAIAVAPASWAGRLWWRAATRALDAAVLAAVEAALDSRTMVEVVDRVAARALRGPELEHVVETALASPAVARSLARVIESELLDTVVERLLESEQLWRLVEEVARSPAVTDAITQQGLGFADQVADGVRTRSRDADAWLERVVRRALRRAVADGGAA